MIAAKYPADKILGQYGFALAFQLSRERSKKTEEVFLVGSRRSGGKSKSLRAPFLLPAFSFGEAKENAELQLQICTMYQLFSSFSETSKASPMRGSCRRRRLMRWTVPRKRNCPTSSVTASPCHLPLIGEGIGGVQIKNSPRKGADQQIWPVPSMDGRYSTATSFKSDTPVSGGA